MQFVNQQQPMTVVTQPGGAVMSQPTVITQNIAPLPSEDKFKSSAASQMVVLSVIQLAMGILCLIFGIILIPVDNHSNQGSDIAFIGYGIWIGLYFAFVGAISLAAAKTNSKCLIIASMILNIFCTCSWCVILTGMAAVGLILTSDNDCTYSYYFSFCGSDSVSNTFYALESLMLIMSIAEFAITIWCAVLCCGAVCSCCKTSTVRQVVHYNAGMGMPGQQITMFPSVPATSYTSYPVTYPAGYPVGYAAGYPAAPGYPVGVHQQPPNGGYTMQPQAPPTYYPTEPNKTQDL